MALLRITRTTEALHLEGEIDLAVTDQLAEALQESARAGVTAIDVSAVTFIDSTGLRTLISAARDLNGQGPLVLVSPSTAVRRLLDIALPGGVPSIAVRDA